MQNRLHFVAIVVLIGVAAQAGADHYVAQSGQTPDHVGGYTTWSGAASNIQYAINAAADNATLWVGPGRYLLPTNATAYSSISNVVTIDKPLTLRGSNNVPSTVIIDGEGTNRGIFVTYNVNTSDRFTLRDLTVSNAHSQGIYFYAASNGRAWTGVVDNCVVTHAVNGVGVYGRHYDTDRTLVIFDSVLSNNDGGGIDHYSTLGGDVPYTMVTDTVIENNGGPGFSMHRGTHTFERSIIRSNSGGGVSCGGGDLTMYSCLIESNQRSGFGAAIFAWNSLSRAYLHNATVVTNSGSGGALHTSSGGTILGYNAIAYFNSPANWENDGSVNFTNSCSTGLSGSGNIQDDPEFLDLAGHDFHIPKTSPCANSGTNLAWMTGATDLDGYPRIDSGPRIVDMGCYEAVYYGTVITVQ